MPSNMPMKKSVCTIRFAAGGVLVAMQACAPLQLPGNGREPTMEQWARVEEDLRQANIERQMFDATHPLVGKRAAAAALELIADGYQCEVGLMDSVRALPDELRIVPAKKALLFCERKSPDPADFCTERHVRLAATWPDITVGLSVLKEQMNEVVVTQRTFRCDTPADVAIHLKHRQEGRQD